MCRAIELRDDERKRVIRLSTEYVKKLENDIGPFTSVLYGSYARGDFNIGSDIDILIISDNLPANMLERMELLYHYVEGGIEPKGYTKAEFSKMLNSNNPLVIDALKNGEVLSDDGFWRKVLKKY